MESPRIERAGRLIESLDDWRVFAGPKSPDQWQPERSAYELARAWCEPDGPRMPDQLRRLLDSRAETRAAVVERYLPEHRIPFDDHGGEPRNADMAFVGRTSEGKFAVTIEAKADEPFGATVAETFSDALERLIENPRSRGIRRIEDLAQSLFGVRQKKHPKIGALRYQLLTAVAGSIAYASAEAADIAVLVIHEFKTTKTDEAMHKANAQDVAAFLLRMGGALAPTETFDTSNQLIGPFCVPGNPLFGKPAPLIIGKIMTDRH